MKCQAYGKTDPGLARSRNEDYFLADDELGLYLVCDGMGGHDAGEVASELAARTIAQELRSRAATLHRYTQAPSTELRARVRGILDEAVQKACHTLWEASGAPSSESERSMGTTLSMLLVCGRYAFVVHVGDSRVYLVRNGGIHQLTEDHSLVNEMLKQGLLTEERAEGYPFANFVTRAIGVHPEVQPDILHIELMNGDTYLLCSDGLTKTAQPEELLDAILANELEQLPDVLVFMANEAGGKDNITAVVVGIADHGTTQTLQHSDLVARKIDTLSRIPIFSGFDYKEMVKLLEIIELRAVRAREVVIDEGDLGEDMYIILGGKADVFKQEQQINELVPGDFFGELSLIDDVPRSATVTAREHLMVLVLERKRFFALLDTSPKMAVKIYWSFLKRMSAQIRDKDDELYRLRRLLDASTAANER